MSQLKNFLNYFIIKSKRLKKNIKMHIRHFIILLSIEKNTIMQLRFPVLKVFFKKSFQLWWKFGLASHLKK